HAADVVRPLVHDDLVAVARRDARRPQAGGAGPDDRDARHYRRMSGSGSACTTARRWVARVSATYSERRPWGSSLRMRAGSTTMTESSSRPFTSRTGTRFTWASIPVRPASAWST